MSTEDSLGCSGRNSQRLGTAAAVRSADADDMIAVKAALRLSAPLPGREGAPAPSLSLSLGLSDCPSG